MSISKFASIIMAFALALLTPLFALSVINAKIENTNQVLADYMAIATTDAITAVKKDSENIFSSVTQRNTAVDTFYTSLCSCFSANDTNLRRNLIKSYVPVVILIDNNGIYINIHGQQAQNGDYSFTPIYQYTKKYDVAGASSDYYMVQYALNDTVKILNGSGTTLFEGSYKSLLSNINENRAQGDNTNAGRIANDLMKIRTETNHTLFPDTNVVDYDTAYALFSVEKQDIIVKAITDRAEYYINSQNQVNGNKYGTYYGLNIPRGFDWRKTISSPTVLSLFQGEQRATFLSTVTNQYAIAGGEMIKNDKFYISNEGGRKLYHCKGCTVHPDNNSGITYNSMKECVDAGAEPCISCILGH